MIYPRLLLARNLLRDDGVIFISIDDNEVAQLRKICDEVFGEDNFINIITVKTKIGGVSGSSEGKSLKDATEFVYVYVKNKSSLLFNPVYVSTPLFNRIKSYEIEGKSWKYTSVMTKLENKILIKEDIRRGIKYFGYEILETMSVTAFAKELGISVDDVYNKYADKIFQTTNAQSSIRQTVMKETERENFPMIGCEYAPIKGKNEGQSIEVLYKGDQRRMMMFLADAVEKIDGTYYYLDKITSLWDDIEYNNLTKEGDVEFPNGKKPIKMVQRMLNLVTAKDSLILDFFSGSGSTAHAVMKLNAEDGGNRKFIMVQLPEPCAPDSEAFKAGYKNICEIGKERIRKAGNKIREEAGLNGQNLDIGFRVFKTADSNMKDVYYGAGEYKQENLDLFVSNIKEDRTPLDLLYGCLLDWALPLSLPHTEEKIDGFTVHIVRADTLSADATESAALIACFDENISEKALSGIAKKKPLRAVFRDAGFASDPAKINVFEIFKLHAPDTQVKVI
jgi:adenine-specific DNA-methyltransferase